MIDVVYFTTNHSFSDHRELRFSLRSLALYISGVQRVFVAGSRPTWLRGVVHLPEADPFTHNKDANIIRKMLAVCQPERGLSNPFLFVNDDHYFSQDGEAVAFPYYHKGELKGGPSLHREYSRRLANTRRLLAGWGRPTRNYDVHTPILIHPACFREIFNTFYWLDLAGPGVVMKSVYANSRPEIAGVYLADCKLTARTHGSVEGWLEVLRQRPCWSTGEHLPRLVWQLLERLYPEPSSYEAGPRR